MEVSPFMSDAPELTPVRDHHRFDETALAAYLSGHMDGDFADMQVRQFEGGQSNPTFLIDAGDDSYVMRKKPPGDLLKSAHAIDREYRVMAALRDSGVPVPQTFLLCEDESVVGTAFFVMQNVEGRVIPSITLPDFSPADRRALYSDFITVLAALHATDHKAIGLGDFGREGNYFARQISRWSRQYVASKTDDIPEMEKLMEWLPENMPEDDATSIVHGDYRIGNCIIHPAEPKVVAVLDWELSTTGHPLGDLAYCCMGYYSPHPDIGTFPEPGSGIPEEGELIDMYCSAMGRGAIEQWNFHISLSLFRSASIAQGVYKRGLDGNASSDHWQSAGPMCVRVSKHAWEAAQRG
jgi:aminoglycoside phosphotransferase (APT) family kinase protein